MRDFVSKDGEIQSIVALKEQAGVTSGLGIIPYHETYPYKVSSVELWTGEYWHRPVMFFNNENERRLLVNTYQKLESVAREVSEFSWQADVRITQRNARKKLRRGEVIPLVYPLQYEPLKDQQDRQVSVRMTDSVMISNNLTGENVPHLRLQIINPERLTMHHGLSLGKGDRVFLVIADKSYEEKRNLETGHRYKPYLMVAKKNGDQIICQASGITKRRAEITYISRKSRSKKKLEPEMATTLTFNLDENFGPNFGIFASQVRNLDNKGKIRSEGGRICGMTFNLGSMRIIDVGFSRLGLSYSDIHMDSRHPLILGKGDFVRMLNGFTNGEPNPQKNWVVNPVLAKKS